VLVTGAGGFIGSHLSETLAGSGAQVRAFVHYNAQGTRGWLDNTKVGDQVEFFYGDICDRDSINRAVDGMEYVFHLAALIAIPYSYQVPMSFVRTNIEGTLNVLMAARKYGVARVIHTSTSEVYGSANYIPIDEGHALQGQSPYSASKIGSDKMVEAFNLSFELPVVTVRPFNTYGPRQSSRAIIPTIISQCLNEKKVRLGNLEPTRDMTFVSDTVDGFIAAAMSPESVGKTVNLGSGAEISIGDLARMICELIGESVDIEVENKRVRPEGSEVDRLCADNSLARTILNWEPKVSLKDGLARTISWVRENLALYRTDEYVI